MNRQSIKPANTKINIESMFYRIDETSMSISIVVLSYISIVVLLYCCAVVLSYRNTDSMKQGNKQVNQRTSQDLHP
jgi:hypothetical protein